MKRPKWLSNGVRTKWIVYDRSSQKLKTIQATDQKEAIKRSLMHGVVPKKTGDVRPRVGGYRKSLMNEKEFQEFMKRLKSE